jgi:hypothetical protein
MRMSVGISVTFRRLIQSGCSSASIRATRSRARAVRAGGGRGRYMRRGGAERPVVKNRRMGVEGRFGMFQ